MAQRSKSKSSPRVLKPHGDALINVTQGAGFQELVQVAPGVIRPGEASQTCHFRVAER